MQKKRLIRVLVTAVLTTSVAAWGQTVYQKEPGNDEYAARVDQLMFDTHRLNPRLMSMGGAYTANSWGSDALWGNPAGLAGIESVEAEIFGGFSELSGDMTYNGNLGFTDGSRIRPDGDADGDFWNCDLGVAVPIDELTTLGFGLETLRSCDESDDLMDWDHDALKGFISAARKLSETVSVGYRLAILDQGRDGDSHGEAGPNTQVIPFNDSTDRESEVDWSSTFDHTLGLLFEASETWTLGVEVGYLHGNFDLNSETVIRTTTIPIIDEKIEMDLNGDIDRFHFRGGAAVDLSERTLLAFDLGYETSEWDYDSYTGPLGETVRGADEELDQFSIHLGLEHDVNEWLVLRGGVSHTWADYENSFAERPYDLDVDYPSVSAGFGVVRGRVEFNYTLGYVAEGDGDWNTSAGLRVKF